MFAWSWAGEAERSSGAVAASDQALNATGSVQAREPDQRLVFTYAWIGRDGNTDGGTTVEVMILARRREQSSPRRPPARPR